MRQKVWVLSVYAYGSDHATIRVFSTKERAIEHVLDGIREDRRNLESHYEDSDYKPELQPLDELLAEVRSSLEENEFFSRCGDAYVLDEEDVL